MKVMDLSVDAFQAMLDPLAKKEDISNLESKITSLQDENKALSQKVDALSSKCRQLEEQMQAVYIWKNSGNLVVKLDRGGDDIESAKNRLVTLCAEIAKQPAIIDKGMIRQLRIGDNRKFLFKMFLNDPKDHPKYWIIARHGCQYLKRLPQRDKRAAIEAIISKTFLDEEVSK